ncbi:MAG: restriction endonuclease subunit S [Campylobacterota bacterium]|nr:restriction endonuclease subunit S [Campylobacterota bacterium]
MEVKKLKEVCENLDNRRIPITKHKRESGNIPYYGASGIVDYVDSYIFDENLLLVSEDGANLLARTYPIAFSISGKTWVNNHAHVLRFKNLISQNFIEYYLNSIKLDDYISGMAQPKLNQKMLNSIEVPFPALEEQKQIVAILDEAFEAIEIAKTNIEKNLANSKELFQSKLNEIFSQKGEGWEEKKLGDVCKLYQGLAINKKTKHLLVEKSSLPLLRIKDLKKNTEEQFVSEIGYPENSRVYKNEIIYTRTGSLGLVFINKEGILHNNSFKVIPNEEVVNDYLYWWLQHDNFTNKIIKLASKAAQPDISHKLFKEQSIIIPEKEFQNKNIILIDKLNNDIKMIEVKYQQKLSYLEELKKSILQKAFNGELV